MTGQTQATIGDFSILPVAIPALPSFPKAVVHHIYVRRNAPKIPTAADARNLFLANVPVDSTEVHIRGVFSSLIGNGRFESVSFEHERHSSNAATDVEPAQAARLSAHARKRKRGQDDDDEAETAKKEDLASRLPATWTRTLKRSGSTAVVVLADEKSVEKALTAVAKAHKTKKYPAWGSGIAEESAQPLGIPWLRAHARLVYPRDRDAVQAGVDAFFTAFGRREREAIELAKRLRSEPDEDGFVTVTRGSGAGRRAAAGRDEAEEARRRELEKAAKKKSEMTDFYRFQLRERKKAEQAALLRKFDEDRRKVQALREKRGKFRPET